MTLAQATAELEAARAEWADATHRLTAAAKGDQVPLEVKRALLDHLAKGTRYLEAVDRFVAAGGR